MTKHNALFDNKGRVIHPLPEWLFGAPALAKDGNGTASWVSSQASPLFQKGTSGYLARLNSGDQSGDDWGAVYIPVNQLPTYEFNETMWSWHQTNNEAYGMNMVIWLQALTDFDKRVEVTQAPSGSTLEKGSGWNAHELNRDTVQFFYYGENVVGSDLVAGTQYTWKQFQGDNLFKNWLIYRISFEWGWYSTGTFEDAYLADVSLNGQIIVIQPSTSELLLNANPIPFEVRVVKNFDAAAQYTANDVMSDDVCTTTSPTEYWTFPNMAKEKGGYGVIDFATLFLETENQEPRIDLLLFNAIPTGVLTDNLPNTNPVKADIASWVGNLAFVATNKEAALVASTSQMGPSTVGGTPVYYKCAAGSTTLYGVTVTRTTVTLDTNGDCAIALQGMHR